jgi:hypothetical protein
VLSELGYSDLYRGNTDQKSPMGKQRQKPGADHPSSRSSGGSKEGNMLIYPMNWERVSGHHFLFSADRSSLHTEKAQVICFFACITCFSRECAPPIKSSSSSLKQWGFYHVPLFTARAVVPGTFVAWWGSTLDFTGPCPGTGISGMHPHRAS